MKIEPVYNYLTVPYTKVNTGRKVMGGRAKKAKRLIRTTNSCDYICERFLAISSYGYNEIKYVCQE